MDVVELSTPLKFVPWEEENSLSKNHTEPPAFIGLAIGEECVRIRTRACPDGAFDRQLNLDDLLDACMSLLPENAFTLLLMVNHDIYENDDDDYCCGRAYGASRVAVVSNARYNPVLDTDLDASREHAWPASHCASYIQSLVKPAKKKKRAKLDPENIADRATSPSPLEAAVAAYKALPSLLDSPSMQLLDGLYLSRVCRTASHEVGHCFGFDHCVYYACMMQGTASGEEDARQPPYLCPVDMAKWRKAIARSRPGLKEAQIYQGLLEFCEQRPNVHLFAAFAAWIRRHLELSAKNLN
jgi:archaemetzincin